MKAAAAVALTVGLTVSAVVFADAFPPAPRQIDRGLLAARDIPAVEYSYGPRATLSAGGETGLWRWRFAAANARLSVFGLLSVDNATSPGAMPQELLRAVFGATWALGWRDASRRVDWEFAIGLFRLIARTIADYDAQPLATATGIPVGGGGTYLAVEGAWRRTWPGGWTTTVRAGKHIYLAGILRLASEASGSAVGNYTADALLQAPHTDLALSVPLVPRWRLHTALRAEWWWPADDSARGSGLVRVVAGPVRQAQTGDWMPFVAAEAGGGAGYLINRREVRLMVGVRHALAR